MPFRRYALFLPEVEDLFEPFRSDSLFKEDAIYLDAVAKEQHVLPEVLLQFQLADGLTMFDIVKIRRLLNFLRELMAQKLLPLLETDPMIAYRSLLPVLHKDKLMWFLNQCVSSEAAEAFLRLATYDRASDGGIFDVQYQPLIAGQNHYLIPFNVLCASDLLRNMLYTQGKKIQKKNDDSPMQRLVAGALRKRFPQVAEGRKIRVDGLVLEIDVMVVVGRKLLVIECKSPFHPCGTHELRTSYEHLRKARKQLDRLRAGLQREEVRRRLFQNLHWDPSSVSGILTCVVTGNRIFNGYVIGGHPVRPAYEFINMVGMGRILIEDQYVRVWRNSEFQPQDLVDYLEGSTIHADAFIAFVEAVQDYSLSGSKMFVWTYVLDAERLAQTMKARYQSLPAEILDHVEV